MRFGKMPNKIRRTKDRDPETSCIRYDTSKAVRKDFDLEEVLSNSKENKGLERKMKELKSSSQIETLPIGKDKFGVYLSHYFKGDSQKKLSSVEYIYLNKYANLSPLDKEEVERLKKKKFSDLNFYKIAFDYYKTAIRFRLTGNVYKHYRRKRRLSIFSKIKDKIWMSF